MIRFDDKLDFTTDEVNECDKIGIAIDNRDISIIQTYFANITVESINDQIKDIIKIRKIEDKLEKVKPKKIEELYRTNHNVNRFEINKLIQLYSMVLWYKESLEGWGNAEDASEAEEIFKYFEDI